MNLDFSVERIPVLMVQEDTKNYPHITPAEGYTIRPYQEGDEYFWASVECRVGQFKTMAEGLACFRREFAYDPERMKTNCLFACDPTGQPVGFCSLWDGDTFGDTRLRLHWMAVDPDHQGKRISQSLLTALFDLYNAQGHEGFLYLITSTHSNQAIRLYKRFGFKAYKDEQPVNWPVKDYETANARAWDIIDGKNDAYDAQKASASIRPAYELTPARSFRYTTLCEADMQDLVACGIRHIELSPGGIGVDFGSREEDIARLQETKAMLDRVGVRVLSVHLPFGWDWDASTTNEAHHLFLLQRQLNYAKLFSIFDPVRYILHPCYWPIPETESAVRIAHIRENAATLAFETGKQVCIEDLLIGRIGGSSDELLTLAEGLDNVGFCVDVNHFMRERPEDAIRKLGDRVWTVHISDYDFINERHWLPGEGKNDWNAIIGALEAVGYSGPFLYELAKGYTNAQVAENYRELFEAYNRR